MATITSEQVAKIVQERLNRAGNGSVISVRVLADQVRPGEDGQNWWYVPVSYQQDPYSLYKYYDAFSMVEEELEEQENLNVLLVPRIVYHPDHN